MKHIALLLLLFSSNNLYADRIDDAFYEATKQVDEYFNTHTKKNWQLTPNEINKVKELAHQGDVEAQYLLARIYDNGQKNLQQDLKEALKWYIKSAQQGLAEAQRMLGYKYEYGQGVKQDNKIALKWYNRAAEQNESTSQWILGNKYKNGDGVPKNKVTAIEWYGKSCDNGNQDGCDEYRKLKEEKCCIFW